MDAQRIASTPEDADALYAWWDGDSLQEGAVLTVATNEIAVFVDESVAVQELGPGTHTLTAASNPELKIYFAKKVGHTKTIEVCFVKTQEWPFAYHGLVDEEAEDGPSFDGTATLKLVSATQFVEAMLEVEATAYDEEGNSTVAEGEEAPTIDDWVADQLYAETAAFIAQAGSSAAARAEELVPKLSEAVSQGGMEVVRVTLETHGSAAAPAAGAASAPAPAPAAGASFCGQCGARQEASGRFCGACGAPRS